MLIVSISDCYWSFVIVSSVDCERLWAKVERLKTKANTRNDLYAEGDYTGGASESVEEAIDSIKDKIENKLKSLRDIF